MKKIVLLTLILMSVLTSCDTDDTRQVYDSGELTYFTGPYSYTNEVVERQILFNIYTDTNIKVEVGSTVKTAADRTYTISVDPTSTAQEGVEFTTSGNTVTIPAGEYVAYYPISVNFDNLIAGDETTVVLDLSSADNPIASFKTVFELRMSKICTSNLGGTYEVTTTYGYHDFLPDFNPHTTTMDIVPMSDITYFVQDFSGGLYTEGPYSSAYGTGPTSFDLIFTDTCNNISWVDQSDPWGSVEMNGVNSVDPDTGIITTSWLCTGYGENGVSVYVPQ